MSPRDGSNVYHRPVGTDAVTDTTIESTKYNSNVADVEQDLNLPRPIVAGGTGANNATDAMTSLQGDKAYQIVTNYDSYPFISGSFYSAAGATSAPTGNAFIGHCYTADPAVAPPAVPASANMFIEARDVTTGLLYVRQKTANVWGTWAQQAGSTATLDAAYVNSSGDTMTGPLVLPADPTLALQSATKQYVDTGDATGITAIGARAVRYDAAQGLTAAQQVQARQNIYAAPFDALAYSGMQINGSMEVSQEKGAGITSVSGQFILDGWVYYNTSTATVLSGQLVNPVAGLSAGLFMQTTVVQATLTGSQFNAVTHSIEGYRFARMAWGTANAQPLTIAFWSGHHTVGTYSIAVRNGDDTRTCCVTYTQNAADVWEYKTVTVPGDTAGSWPVGNTAGAKIQFANACGPTVTAPAANTWYSAGYVGAPGQVNGVASAAYFKIGGVVVLPGIEAPSAARAPLIMRPYDQELLTCKRYFRQGVAEGAGIATSTTAVQFSINHVGMRVAPTVVAAGVLTITDIIASNYNQSSPNIGITLNSADWGIYLLANYAGLVAGRVYVFRDATGGKVINFDARL